MVRERWNERKENEEENKWKRKREMKKNGSGWWWKEGVLGFCFLNELWRLSMKTESQDGFSKKWV